MTNWRRHLASGRSGEGEGGGGKGAPLTPQGPAPPTSEATPPFKPLQGKRGTLTGKAVNPSPPHLSALPPRELGMGRDLLMSRRPSPWDPAPELPQTLCPPAPETCGGRGQWQCVTVTSFGCWLGGGPFLAFHDQGSIVFP